MEIEGRGGHAARPQEARDPIVAAAALITALQAIVARRFFGLGGKRLAYTTVICSLLLVALFVRGLAGTAFHG